VSQEPRSGSPSTAYNMKVETALGAGGWLAIGAILLTGGCDVRLSPFRALSMDAGPGPKDAAPAVTDSAAESGLPIPCPDEILGFATTNGGTTGGGGLTPLVVNASDSDAFAKLSTYANEKMPGPLVIELVGMVAFPGPDDSGSSEQQIRVSSEKTIVGSGAASGLTGGGLNLTGSDNVIIKNLVISKALGTDAISLNQSTHVWIDHCDLSSDRGADADTYDGLVDITRASDLVTVSWTRYHDHDDTGIIGHSDSNAAQDTGFLHVTYHHDLFTNVTAGPRVRFGSVHLFNDYFEGIGYYGVASTMGALVMVDDSYFKNIPSPVDPAMPGWPLTTTLPDSAEPGYFWPVNNLTDSTDGGNNLSTLAMQWTPPYPYTPDSVTSVPALVAACAGTGKISTPAHD
jgi:pectate lyase